MALHFLGSSERAADDCYSWAPAPTATHARSAFDTDSSLKFLAAAAMRVSAWAKGMGGCLSPFFNL